jgi:hypothetical protein
MGLTATATITINGLWINRNMLCDC